MAVRQIFAELGTGMRRNISMSIALVVTMTVSLLLAALGLLIQTQASNIESAVGNQLQVQVLMCTKNSDPSSGTCIGGAATDAQRDTVEEALGSSPEVEDFRFQDAQQTYQQTIDLQEQNDEFPQEVIDTLRPSDFAGIYYITLSDPREFEGLESQLQGLDGVASFADYRDTYGPLFTLLDVLRWTALVASVVLIVAAVLQVSNTIRMTAFARRREIGIMRLVGASSWHIQLPFVLESLVSALIAAALTCGALAGIMKFVIYDDLRANADVIFLWVDWGDAIQVGGLIAVLAVVLAMLPTLVMTRKYLKV